MLHQGRPTLSLQIELICDLSEQICQLLRVVNLDRDHCEAQVSDEYAEEKQTQNQAWQGLELVTTRRQVQVDTLREQVQLETALLTTAIFLHCFPLQLICRLLRLCLSANYFVVFSGL